MATRVKTQLGINCRAQFEQEIDVIASLQTQLETLEAEQNQAILNVRDNYGPKIEGIKKQVKASLTSCSEFALRERDGLFAKDAKTAETALAKYGFRTSTPQVKTVSKWSLDRALEAILKAGKRLFVRTKDEIDKEAILKAHRDGDVTAAELRAFGLVVAQDESFWVEPKTDGTKSATA